MALFVGSDGGVMDTIRCDEKDYIIWKWHPNGTSSGSSKRANAIRWGSSLRVRNGSVAVFVYHQDNGILEDYIVGPYDGILKTENLPVIASIIGKFYDGGTPFQAEIYFINTADVIQVQFGVPFFDVYDPKFRDFGVPIAVRGTINFRIADYKEFISLHRLDEFSTGNFKEQTRSYISRAVKNIIISAPDRYGIPVLQIERHISDINTLVEKELAEELRRSYAVSVSRVDISDIEVDKKSKGYKKLESLTQNKAVMLVQGTANVFEGMGLHRLGAKKIKNKTIERLNIEDSQDTNMSEQKAESKEKDGSVFGATFLSRKKQITPPPLPITQYYIAINNEQKGPYDIETIKKMVEDYDISEETLVWKEGMKKWHAAGDVKDLKKLFYENK